MLIGRSKLTISLSALRRLLILLAYILLFLEHKEWPSKCIFSLLNKMFDIVISYPWVPKLYHLSTHPKPGEHKKIIFKCLSNTMIKSKLSSFRSITRLSSSSVISSSFRSMTYNHQNLLFHHIVNHLARIYDQEQPSEICMRI